MDEEDFKQFFQEGHGPRSRAYRIEHLSKHGLTDGMIVEARRWNPRELPIVFGQMVFDAESLVEYILICLDYYFLEDEDDEDDELLIHLIHDSQQGFAAEVNQCEELATQDFRGDRSKARSEELLVQGRNLQTEFKEKFEQAQYQNPLQCTFSARDESPIWAPLNIRAIHQFIYKILKTDREMWSKLEEKTTEWRKEFEKEQETHEATK
jgi:hypothetical protein